MLYHWFIDFKSVIDPVFRNILICKAQLKEIWQRETDKRRKLASQRRSVKIEPYDLHTY